MIKFVGLGLILLLNIFFTTSIYAGDPNRQLEQAIARCANYEIGLALQNGANPNIVVNGEPAIARCLDSADAIELLIKHGADVNVRFGGKNDSVLWKAALKGGFIVYNKLLKAGANVNHANKHGQSVLYILARHKKAYNMLGLTLKRGAIPNRADKLGFTPLMVAAREGHAANVQVLLKHGADVNTLDKDNLGALYYAIAQEYIGTVQVLLEAGADTNVQMFTTKSTPLMVAASMGNHIIVKELLRHSANPDAKNNLGDTALDLARLGKKHLVVELLEKQF